MKRLCNLLGIITLGAVIAVSTLTLTGCDNGTTNDGGNNTGGNNTGETPTTGSISIKNSSASYSITWVEVFDVTTSNDVIDETASIATKGGSKTYTVDPGKYIVYIWDSYSYDYEAAHSTQFQINAGGSKTLTYDGYNLY